MFATNITNNMDISITKKPDNLITVLSSLEVGDKIHFARGIYATGYLRSIASQLGQIKGWTLTVRELKGDLAPILVERYADPCENDQI